MNNIYEDLSWLQKPPQEFSKMLTEVSNGNDLRELAQFSLDENQLRRLYKKMKIFQNEEINLSSLTPMRIGVLGNATNALSLIHI